MNRFLTPFFVIALLGPTARAADHGLKVASGFQVTLYADETLANDIYAMTLDKKGRVVVTSQGWIKVLHDTKGTGKADKATIFAKTPTGGMGLCFDGNDLYFCGDGWFSRYRDSKGIGEADGLPEKIVPLRFSEHGGHAMRRGPDGCWYIIGGNSSEFTAKQHATLPNSPIKDIEAGALLRLSPDGKKCEAIAHGFRNPYDFDFNPAGDLFTYDSDNEEDLFLPWYAPTRLYHIGYGQHHGWRLGGYRRSWGRADYYPDTVDILWPVGRGSPTGVACYRHDQFPEHYRGGLFALDWTFGKVYFFPLEADGATYKTKPETFLESVGTSGFDPTDIVVAPDGSLFISMGGRGTRGAVYHIEYVGDAKAPVKRDEEPADDLHAVLRAHQPLDAWSRAVWMPLARKLGAVPFAAVVADKKEDGAARMRAVEVLTELFGGLPPATAKAGAKASSPLIRARVAWSLGRAPSEGLIDILQCLAEDPHPRVRDYSLASLADHMADMDPEKARAYAVANLGHSDKRVRQAATRLASLLPETAWKSLWRERDQLSPQARSSAALAAIWRDPSLANADDIIDAALSIISDAKDTNLRLQAIRIVVLALGDFRLKDPPVEVYSAYSLAGSLKGREALVKRILQAARPVFPSGDANLDVESSRLLAILEDDDANVLCKVAAMWTEKSSPTQDLHYLIVYSRLRGPRDRPAADQVAAAILGLDRKLAGQEQRNKQNWSVRLSEALVNLLKLDPNLADTLLKHPDLVNAGHVLLAAKLDAEHRERAARLFVKAAKTDAEFAWSPQLVELLGLLPKEETFPLFREHWSHFGLRDSMLLQFSLAPEETDREMFLTGFDSPQSAVTLACLASLERLPRDPSAKNLVPVLRLLQHLQQEPKEKALREKTVALIARQSAQIFAYKEGATDPPALKRAQQPIFDWFMKEHPKLADALNGSLAEDASHWNQLLKAVDWTKGDAKRGATIFRDRACVTCHAGPGRLGPDLTGVATRFSRDDLFTAIIDPSRDVAPSYRVTIIETKDGKTYSGIAAYESAETVILQTGAAMTMRISTRDIDSRRPSNKSLMPDGLLKDLKADDLADLYSYLQTLKSPTEPAPK
jgi:putative membrane-bound dehydrogenase-like protein